MPRAPRVQHLCLSFLSATKAGAQKSSETMGIGGWSWNNQWVFVRNHHYYATSYGIEMQVDLLWRHYNPWWACAVSVTYWSLSVSFCLCWLFSLFPHIQNYTYHYYQELMRTEGPKEYPTACNSLDRARVLQTTLFGKPWHSMCRRCKMQNTGLSINYMQVC